MQKGHSEKLMHLVWKTVNLRDLRQKTYNNFNTYFNFVCMSEFGVRDSDMGAHNLHDSEGTGVGQVLKVQADQVSTYGAGLSSGWS